MDEQVISVDIKNFTKKELQCRCCGKFVKNDKALIALQAFRDYLNRLFKKEVRLYITCGTRCTKHNKEVRGAAGSYHLTGEAFDVFSTDISASQIYNAAIFSNLFSTIIQYTKSQFIHLDTRAIDNKKTPFHWIEHK